MSMLASRLLAGVAVLAGVCLSLAGIGASANWFPNLLTFVNASEDKSGLSASNFETGVPSAFVTAGNEPGVTPEDYAADKDFSIAAVEAPLDDSAVTPDGVGKDEDTADVSDSDDLRLTYAQSLSINFHGYREISGDFSVNEDNTVSIPAIGRVDLGVYTAHQLEEVLGRKVVQHTGRTSTVNVQVKTFSPIFVTGEVQNSGAFAWQRGMRVLHAKALAGGIFRPKVSEYVDASTAQTQLGNATIRLKHGLARFERLSAEIEGRQSLSIPDRLISLVSYDEAERLIRKEEELLRAQSETLKSNLAALNASYEAAQIEIERLNELDRSLEARVKEQSAHMKSVKVVFDKGHMTALRMFNLRSQLAEMESRLAGVKVAKAKAEAAVLEIKRDQIALGEKRMSTLVSQRLTLAQQIQEFEVDLKGAVALGDRIEKAAAVATGAVAEGNVEESYEIVRNTGDGEARRIKATQLDKILPGDIVRIKLKKTGQSATAMGSTAPLDEFRREKNAAKRYVDSDGLNPGEVAPGMAEQWFRAPSFEKLPATQKPRRSSSKFEGRTGVLVPPLPIPRGTFVGGLASFAPSN